VCKGTTCASFILSGKTEDSIDLFTKFDHIFLSAFRKGYGCQITLLKVIENWKKALENKYVAAILMNLSKAFDCTYLPHDRLLLKLKSSRLKVNFLSLVFFPTAIA
jgi:hypothetical protein